MKTFTASTKTKRSAKHCDTATISTRKRKLNALENVGNNDENEKENQQQQQRYGNKAKTNGSSLFDLNDFFTNSSSQNNNTHKE